MGPFPVSFGNIYILLAVDCVSKWVEAKATRSDDAKAVINFLKSNVFVRFVVPRALIRYGDALLQQNDGGLIEEVQRDPPCFNSLPPSNEWSSGSFKS